MWTPVRPRSMRECVEPDSTADDHRRRSRWHRPVFGLVAVAGFIGTGVVVAEAATSSSDGGTVLVPMVPCRLFDTRPDGVGNRLSPLRSNETMLQQVTGANGNCMIPTDATGVSLNVTRSMAPSPAT